MLPIDSKVSVLLSPSGGWNVQKVTNLFSPLETALILAIPISHDRSPDRLCWHIDKKGRYLVKSGYKLAIALRPQTRHRHPITFSKHFGLLYRGCVTKENHHLFVACLFEFYIVSIEFGSTRFAN